ncbi:hypothetical protein ABEB36_015831, partial [Hypothenemus hampei]
GKTELGQIQGSPDSRPEISPVSGEGAGKIEVGAACRFLTIFDERSSMEAEDEIIGKAQDEVNRKLQRQRTYTAGTSTPIEILGSDSEGETETPADIYLPVQAQLNPQVHEPGSNTGIKDIAADDTSMENWIKGLVRATGKKTTQADQIQNLEEARGLKELARKRFREHTPPHPFFTINKKKKKRSPQNTTDWQTQQNTVHAHKNHNEQINNDLDITRVSITINKLIEELNKNIEKNTKKEIKEISTKLNRQAEEMKKIMAQIDTLYQTQVTKDKQIKAMESENKQLRDEIKKLKTERHDEASRHMADIQHRSISTQTTDNPPNPNQYTITQTNQIDTYIKVQRACRQGMGRRKF